MCPGICIKWAVELRHSISHHHDVTGIVFPGGHSLNKVKLFNFPAKFESVLWVWIKFYSWNLPPADEGQN